MGQNKIVRKLNRELRQKYLNEGIEPTHKYCSVCNELKTLSEFCKSNDGSKLFGVDSKCKICNGKRSKEYLSIPENKAKRDNYIEKYNIENKDKIKNTKDTYKKNNKDKIKVTSAIYYQKNKQKKNKRTSERNATDENFRNKRLLRSRLWNVMNGKKNKKACEYGIDWAACIAHLGPRPDNINDFHIDHIVPCSCFDFTNPSHPAICFHPTNLRWALADENLAKNDTIFPELIEQYNLHWIVESLNLNIDEWNSKL